MRCTSHALGLISSGIPACCTYMLPHPRKSAAIFSFLLIAALTDSTLESSKLACRSRGRTVDSLEEQGGDQAHGCEGGEHTEEVLMA